MKPPSLSFRTLLLLAVSLPAALPAQTVVPENLTQVETARSRACAETLSRLAQLDETMAPYGARAARLNALGRAVSLEKPEDAAPLDPGDPVEDAVAQWFATDSVLARRFIEEQDSSLVAQRRQARNIILDRLRQALEELSAQAQTEISDEGDLESSAQECVGAILVRSAVVEACGSMSSPVCDAARDEEASGVYRFVDEAPDLWSVEQYGPWTKPEPLQLAPDGSLTGARTGARARRGNVLFTLSLAPLVERRSDLTEEEVAEFDANLDSLAFTFSHPLLVMAPAFEIQVNLPAPLAGENLYVVHFGDLSGDDVIWQIEAGSGGVVRQAFPATETDLARLLAGEMVSLTALKTPEEEGAMATAVFTLPLLQVAQETSVRSLLQYMAQGGFDRDLKLLVPPGGLP